jgi:hypothetical protein
MYKKLLFTSLLLLFNIFVIPYACADEYAVVSSFQRKDLPAPGPAMPYPQPPAYLKPQAPSEGPAPLGFFDNVVIDGGFQVRLVTGKDANVDVQGPRELVVVETRGQTLYISLRKDTEVPPTGELIPVTVSAYGIHNLRVLGNSVVHGDHIHGQELCITASGNSKVYFRGVVHLKRLVQTGQSYVNIRWVDSCDLGIALADRSCAKIAGKVQELHARLFGAAVLDAKYVRTKYAFIQALQESTGTVTVIQSLNAFARENANIYYYKTSHMVDADSRQSGNVLQLGHWN